MIDDGRAIDPSSQKVVEVIKDEKLISENETLTKKVEELESEKVISDKKIEDLESELVESKSKEVDPLAGKK